MEVSFLGYLGRHTAQGFTINQDRQLDHIISLSCFVIIDKLKGYVTIIHLVKSIDHVELN